MYSFMIEMEGIKHNSGCYYQVKSPNSYNEFKIIINDNAGKLQLQTLFQKIVSNVYCCKVLLLRIKTGKIISIMYTSKREWEADFVA